MARKAYLFMLALGAGSLGCESILGLSVGTPRELGEAGAGGMAVGGSGGAGGSAGGGGAGGVGGSATSNCLGAQVEEKRAVFSDLGNPRDLQADGTYVYLFLRPGSRDTVYRFQHAPMLGTELESFAPADADTHVLEGLSLTTSYVAWLTRGGNVASVKTKEKTVTGNPSDLHDLTNAGSANPFATEGEALWWSTDNGNQQVLFQSLPSHPVVTALDFFIGLSSDGPIAVVGDSIYIGSDSKIEIYDTVSDSFGDFALGRPDSMFVRGAYLYWIQGSVLSRALLDDGNSVQVIIDELRTITDVAIHGPCIVWLDSEGTVRTRDGSGGETAVLLSDEASATSIEVTENFVFVGVGGAGTGSIIAIPIGE